ncbi:MAG: hypothetical protein MJ065_02535 [Oscillospiraceae bacterium]|nr:hypothetical protein [Oscillospiraceae bacterium]
MKARAYLAAGVLGLSGAAGLNCIFIYVFSFPVRRHPYAYPFSLIGGLLAALAAVAACALLLYYITKLPQGARGKAIFESIGIILLTFSAGFFLFAYAYELAAGIVHRLDP